MRWLDKVLTVNVTVSVLSRLVLDLWVLSGSANRCLCWGMHATRMRPRGDVNWPRLCTSTAMTMGRVVAL
eukprot:38936-Pyramimonas_sp.AAC.1